MEQKFEGTPHADIRLQGRRVIRGEVKNDWGLRLQWQVKHNGKVVATPPARASASYEHPSTAPGTYEIVLQMWKYVNYQKDAKGEYVASKFIDISNKVSYKI